MCSVLANKIKIHMKSFPRMQQTERLLKIIMSLKKNQGNKKKLRKLRKQGDMFSNMISHQLKK